VQHPRCDEREVRQAALERDELAVEDTANVVARQLGDASPIVIGGI